MYDHLLYQNGKILWQGILEYNRGYLFFPPVTRVWPWFKISLYGLCMAIAFLVGNYFLQREIHRRKLPAYVADNIILIALFGGLLGAKLFYFVEGPNRWSPFISTYDLFFRYGGLTWYGGLLLAALLIFYYLKKKSISPLSLADYSVPLLAFGYGMGRVGCLLAGDGCYGIAAPPDMPFPWAAAFPNGSAPWMAIVEHYNNVEVKVYNTPLIEALFSFTLALFFYIARFFKSITKWRGALFYAFLFLHSLARFFIEFWRLNEKIFFGLTQAQVISIIVGTFSLFFLVYVRWFRLDISNNVKGTKPDGTSV